MGRTPYTYIFVTLIFFWINKNSHLLMAQSTYPGQVGIGVGLSQWNKPFVNIVNNAKAFKSLNGDELPMDASGWPLSDAQLVLLDAWPLAEWANEMDDPDAYQTDMSGNYLGSFSGQAMLNNGGGDFMISNITYNPVINQTTFELTLPKSGSGLVTLEFTNTQRTPSDGLNTGVTDLKITRPGYDHQTEQTFNNTFLDALGAACFSTIRFTGFTFTDNTNPKYPEEIAWNQRKKTGAATFQWTKDQSYPGVPWEHVVELGNILQKDIWINVPVAASDDYVHKLALLLRDKLDPKLHIYVEYSNEVWNWDFSQAHWNLANADQNGLSYIESYAHRTAEIALIFQEVFGPKSLNNQIRVVNCWQIGWWPPNFQYDEQMEYINDHFAAPHTLIYGLGVAPYFKCREACETGTVAEILQVMRSASDVSVESRELVVDVADFWELPGGVLAYKGGPDTGGGKEKNVVNRILSERSSGMKDLMIYDLTENWFPWGGGLFMYPELAGPYNRHGSWGLTDEVANPDRNFKFEAIREIVGDCNLTSVKSPGSKNGFNLFQNQPNPWHTSTEIAYYLDEPGMVQLIIFSVTGEEITRLVDENKSAGFHKVILNASQFESGVYYYTLQVGSRKESKRFVLMN